MDLIKWIFLMCFMSLANTEITKKLKLSSGYDIPIVGLGTARIKPEVFDQTIAAALEDGYRHFDTAFFYENETPLGKVLKKWFDQGGKREDLFITTKLPAQANKPQSVEKYLNRSLENLGLGYIDMYLIHVPFAVIEGDNYTALALNDDRVHEDVDHVAVWKEMEKQVKAGRVRSIGLSNFNQTQIENIYENSEIKPCNLQVESHAYLQRRSLRELCKQKNIVMTAYAPLGSMKLRKSFFAGTQKDLPPLIENPIVNELAQKYKRTPAQILLRHLIQDGLVVIPESSNPKHKKENIELFDFELSTEDVGKVDSLEVGERGRVFDFLNFHKKLYENPQYPFQRPDNS